MQKELRGREEFRIYCSIRDRDGRDTSVVHEPQRVVERLPVTE